MKQKLFTLFLALIASVGTTFAARDVVPSDAVLKNYYKTGQLCVCIFVPAEMACNDVVFVGTYNRDAYDAWITDVNKLAKFQPVEGYDGWYVVAVNDETPADFEYGKGIQGKPIVLDQNGAFNWQYQVSAATKIRGGVEIVSGFYNIGEIDLIRYTKDAPNVYTIDALKGGNPCTAVYHNYTFTVISDGCDGSAVPFIIGDMTTWNNVQMQLDVEATAANNAPTYYHKCKCAEGTRYQVLSGLKGADGAIIEQPSWDDDSYLQQLVYNEWVRYTENGNVDLTTGANVNITFDVRQKNLRWARCASEDSSTISGTCGDNLTWTLADSTLTISGTGAMTDYPSYSSAPWYDYRSSIKSVIINYGVTSIGGEAFSGCSSLTSVTIGNSVTSIGKDAFEGCSNITSVTWNAKNCNRYNNGYNFGSQVTSFTFGNEVEVIPSSLCEGMEKLTLIAIPNSVTSIGERAFGGCSSLTSVTIGNGVTSIGDYAFSGCSSLTSVTIGNSVTSIGNYAFSGCSSLTSVTIPNNVKSIGEYAFYNCSSLTSVTIGNSVTSIGYGAFGGCSSLTSVTIGNSMTSIGYMAFSGCSSLTSVTIPNSVTSIGELAFWHCSSLTSITIPNSVTSIGESAFSGCSSLTSVTIPNSVTSIGESAFSYCSSLTSVTIGNSVKTIGSSAFEGCVRLGKISLGKNLETIGANAFAECTRLYDIYSYATYPPFAEESSFANYNVYVYVPCEYQRDYILDVVWGKFKFIECISSDNVTTDEIVVTPSENEANVTWPSVNGAATYELVIKDKDGNIVCTLIFNANGQLISIAFNAPSRNGAPAQTQNAGFSFTIIGLDSGTGYDLTLTAKDNSGNTIQTETISFVTTSPQGIEDIPSSSLQGGDRGRLILRDGQVLILRNGKTYTMQGQEVK